MFSFSNQKETITYEPFIGEYISLFNDIKLEIRQKDSIFLKSNYLRKLPIVFDRGNKETPKLQKNKFLIDENLQLGNISVIIRDKISIDKKSALFLFINGTIYNNSTLLKEIYYKENPEDGFLKIIYTLENCFGFSIC